jgi:hypothetical protein
MVPPSGVTLQISLAPTDYPHARYILPHQLRQWGSQVDDVLLVVDMHRSRTGRFAVEWEQRVPLLEALVSEACARDPRVRAVTVDYGAAAARRVADEFFGGRPVPTKDLRGGPFYSYFYALSAARGDLVIHADSDMLFGGGSEHWVADAQALLAADPDILSCSPLPGPPADDGQLVAQHALPYAAPYPAFRFRHFSTRIFALDRARLAARIGALSPSAPPLRGRLRAAAQGNPPYDLPENIISRAMQHAGVIRVDLLGRDAGMWSLHPPHRSAVFYETLPSLVARIEAGNVPAAQRGYYNVNDSLVDWSSARAAQSARPWWQRLGLLVAGNPHAPPPKLL